MIFLCNCQDRRFIPEWKCHRGTPRSNEVSRGIANNDYIPGLDPIIEKYLLHRLINNIVLCPPAGNDTKVYKIPSHENSKENEQSVKEIRCVPIRKLTVPARPRDDPIQTDRRDHPPVRLEGCPGMKKTTTRPCKWKDEGHHCKQDKPACERNPCLEGMA